MLSSSACRALMLRRCSGLFNKQKCARCLKMALPHIGLYLFLFLYLLGGAWTFARIEDATDRLHQIRKLERLRNAYREIAVAASEACPLSSQNPNFRFRIYTSLSKLSSLMEGRDFMLNADDDSQSERLFLPRWTKMASILYALSILTTTGYTSATPTTLLGQWVAIGYGLLGIPLMVLAAVDIGRFLSDVVLTTYGKYRKMWGRLMRACGCAEKKRQIVELVETKAIQVQTHTLRRSTKSKKSGLKRRAKSQPAKRLPLSVNASILLIFCMLGGLVYIGAGGHKTFIEAFFVTFNLVANLTMAEMPNDLNHVLTLFYILIFVTFGLAVLSMCGELAASELKSLFLKIHYFGRKIDWRRNKKEQLEIRIPKFIIFLNRRRSHKRKVEVREMLKIIEAIRKRHPEKGKISSADILQYIHDMNGGARHSIVCIKHQRRDTIAFMPETIEALKFADEMDMDDNSHRSASRTDYEVHHEPRTTNI